LDLLPVPSVLPEPVPEDVVLSDEVEDGLELFLLASVSSTSIGDSAVPPDTLLGFLLGDLSAESTFGANLS
jgi:hypothetical protein